MKPTAIMHMPSSTRNALAGDASKISCMPIHELGDLSHGNFTGSIRYSIRESTLMALHDVHWPE